MKSETLVDILVSRYKWLETQREALDLSVVSHDRAVSELSPTQFAEYARRTSNEPSRQERLKV